MITRIQSTIKSIVEELELKPLKYDTVEFTKSIEEIEKTFYVLDLIHDNITYLKPLVSLDKFKLLDEFEDELINTYLKLIKSKELFTEKSLDDYKTVKYEFRTDLSRKLNAIMIYLTDKSKLKVIEPAKFNPLDLSKYNMIQSMLYLPKFNITDETESSVNVKLKHNNKAIITNIFPLYIESIAEKFGPISTSTEGINKSIIKRFKTIKIVDSIISENNLPLVSPDIVLTMGKHYKTGYGGENYLFSGNNCNSSTNVNVECDKVKANNKIYNNISNLSRCINEKELISILNSEFKPGPSSTMEELFELITPDTDSNYVKTSLKKYYINECIVDMTKSKTGKSAYNELLLIYINHSYQVRRT